MLEEYREKVLVLPSLEACKSISNLPGENKINLIIGDLKILSRRKKNFFVRGKNIKDEAIRQKFLIRLKLI